MQLARKYLDEFGYCLIDRVLDAQQVDAIRRRLEEQATAEQELGIAYEDAGVTESGINQRVWFLINKGRVFRDLLSEPQIRELVQHILGEQYILSSFTANIAKPGGTIGVHVDQWWFPPPVARDMNYIRPGSMTKSLFRDRQFHEAGSDSTAMIAPAVVCNAMWMISDFTADNGATLVVPGSHLWGRLPHTTDNPDIPLVPVVGVAGTVAVFEGRIWHSTGANVSDTARLGVLSYFCGGQFRQQENLTMGTDPAILKEASPDLLELLGFKPFHGYGRVGDPNVDFVRPDEKALGELRPRGNSPRSNH